MLCENLKSVVGYESAWVIGCRINGNSGFNYPAKEEKGSLPDDESNVIVTDDSSKL